MLFRSLQTNTTFVDNVIQFARLVFTGEFSDQPSVTMSVQLDETTIRKKKRDIVKWSVSDEQKIAEVQAGILEDEGEAMLPAPGRFRDFMAANFVLDQNEDMLVGNWNDANHRMARWREASHTANAGVLAVKPTDQAVRAGAREDDVVWIIYVAAERGVTFIDLSATATCTMCHTASEVRARMLPWGANNPDETGHVAVIPLKDNPRRGWWEEEMWLYEDSDPQQSEEDDDAREHQYGGDEAVRPQEALVEAEDSGATDAGAGAGDDRDTVI